MDRRIAIVIARIEGDLSAKTKLAELGDMVNLSASRLRHLFKQETGKTPTQLLRELRLKHAEELLTTSFLSVKEIAASVGLTAGQLIREFKRTYGVVPTDYRDASSNIKTCDVDNEE